MLLGDKLSEFSTVFEGGVSTQKRNNLADSLKMEFGKKFIILPNPIYGDWERYGIFKDKFDLSAQEKDSILKSKLISY